MKCFLLTLSLLALVPSVFVMKSYAGYKLYRIRPANKHQKKFLQNMKIQSNYDFWTESIQVNSDVDVFVDPEKQKQFLTVLQTHGIPSKTKISNYQKIVDKENSVMALRGKKSFSLTQFNTYEQIISHSYSLAERYPNLVSISKIGETYEGREIVGITISNGGENQKNAFFMDGGIHAREWIAPAVVLYVVNQLTANFTANKHLLDNLDWLLVPLANPDGYSYTFTKDRMWRKNRKPVRSNCMGTDANRNFGFRWGGEGASDMPCDDTYRGNFAFSEEESSAIRDFGLANKGRIKLYLTLHSYGNFIMYPWGSSPVLPRDWKDLHKLGKEAAAAIKAVRGTKFKVGNSRRILYGSSGGADDYMKGMQNISYAFAMELPGGGDLGFNPPPAHISSIAAEIWEGIQVFAREAANS